jgi:SAM-dependent methyltransferase
MALANRGCFVEAIDVPSSDYTDVRLFPITDYDGRRIPFLDASSDVVFSPNVLEHAPDLVQLHREIRRVLKPDGCAIHVVPTPSCCVWTIISTFPTSIHYACSLKREVWPRKSFCFSESKRLKSVWAQLARYLQVRSFTNDMGNAGTRSAKFGSFARIGSGAMFKKNGFATVSDAPMGLFYTGNMMFGSNWDFSRRAHLAKILGSACQIFRLRRAACAFEADIGTAAAGSGQF